MCKNFCQRSSGAAELDEWDLGDDLIRGPERMGLLWGKEEQLISKALTFYVKCINDHCPISDIKMQFLTSTRQS